MLKNNLRQLSRTELMLKEEFNFYIEYNQIRNQSIFVRKSQRQKRYDPIYTHSRKYSRKKKIYYCAICQESQKRNYCMWYKSILTKERTNYNESLNDTSSQSKYKDFVVKDILINKQNESSKDTSSTYTTDKDFAVKDTDLYYCEKCNNFQRGNYCFQYENPLIRDKNFKVELVNTIVKQNSYIGSPKDTISTYTTDEDFVVHTDWYCDIVD